MVVIKVIGEAETSFKHDLKYLDGIGCEDEFCDYFGEEEIPLKAKNVRNGYLSFKHLDGKLWSITEYESDELLTDDEIEILKDYTQGQWSDGIGEGFEQEPCTILFDEEVYISPWSSGQQIKVEQSVI